MELQKYNLLFFLFMIFFMKKFLLA